MSCSPTDVVDVVMPQMGVSVAEGTVVAWHKQAGDWVLPDETICEISTDKIDTEVPSPAGGRVAEILVAVNETVPVGTVLARIATDAVAGEAHPTEVTVRHSPVVRRIAEREGVDLTQVPGTGRGGRVRKQDVLAFLDQRGGVAEPAAAPAPMHIESPYVEPAPARPAAPAASGTPEGEPLSRMRRSIAEHMVRSLQTAAHCTSITEADMSAVERARAARGLTALPYVARCVVRALGEHPQINATLEGDRLTHHHDVNLGIAVSLGEGGLIVPVIARAQELSVEGLAVRIRELAARARAGELTADEVRGGTFTITNPGGYGTIASTPIINQPQVAILDLEAVVKRPVVIDDGTGGDAIAIRPMVNLCLSWDHRALDGALAAQFLGAVRAHVQRWEG